MGDRTTVDKPNAAPESAHNHTRNNILGSEVTLFNENK
jgi:hypothetical protein